MNKFIWHLLFLPLLIAACSSPATPTPDEPFVATATAPSSPIAAAEDPCSSQNLPKTVQETDNLMREFEEVSQGTSNLDKAQLPALISNLQRIRRNAEDTKIPACLEILKTHQLNHMNLTIQTWLTFIDGADQQALKQGLDMSRTEHELYSLEYARLLGTTPSIP